MASTNSNSSSGASPGSMPSSSSKVIESHVAAKTSSDAELAQAFRDLARGEQTAQALEANLTNLERKLDDFLASFDEAERQKVEGLTDAKGADVNGRS